MVRELLVGLIESRSIWVHIRTVLRHTASLLIDSRRSTESITTCTPAKQLFKCGGRPDNAPRAQNEPSPPCFSPPPPPAPS